MHHRLGNLEGATISYRSFIVQSSNRELVSKAKEYLAQIEKMPKDQPALTSTTGQAPGAEIEINETTKNESLAILNPSTALSSSSTMSAGTDRRSEQKKFEVRTQSSEDKKTQTPILTVREETGTSQNQQESTTAHNSNFYSKWWFWTPIGVVVAVSAIGIGLGVAARNPDTTGLTELRPFAQ